MSVQYAIRMRSFAVDGTTLWIEDIHELTFEQKKTILKLTVHINMLNLLAFSFVPFFFIKKLRITPYTEKSMNDK